MYHTPPAQLAASRQESVTPAQLAARFQETVAKNALAFWKTRRKESRRDRKWAATRLTVHLKLERKGFITAVL